MKDKKTKDRKVLKRAGTARKKDVLVRSKRALAASAKPRVVGKPFKPGEDPRRHKLGRTSLDRAAFTVKLNNFLCNGIGDPDELAQLLWKYARKGQPWAIKELFDRIAGRSVQPIEVAEVPKMITYTIRYADDNDKSALSPIDEKAEQVLALGRKTEDIDGR